MTKESQNLDKLPPQDIEAEQSVLGSILIDKEAFFRMADIIGPDDFYLDVHKKIYNSLLELSKHSEPMDVLTLSSKLKERGLLVTIGGQSYLTKLVNTVPSAAHITHYADIVRKKSVLRNLIKSSYEIGQLGYREDEDVDVLLDDAEKKIFQITSRASMQNFAPFKASLEEAFERIDRLHKNTGETRGLTTGFVDLDNILAGFQKSDLIILAARPSVGKSAMAMDIARHVASKKIAVGIFSLEMSRDQIVDRLIAAEAGVDLWRLRTGKLSSSGEFNDFTKIQKALGNLSESPLFIDDGSTSSVLQMRAMSRRLQAEHGLGLIIVDYLQLIVPRSSNESMVQQITEVSRSLKALARELNVPVLALSQLSRAVEQRHPPIPRLPDLRESGSLEQDADVVLFIYREAVSANDPQMENMAEIHIAKHRNGPIGKIGLYFDRNSASFKNLTKKAAPEALPPENGATIDDIPS